MPLFSPDDTEHEIVRREDGERGLCAFEMCDVWRVDGEEEYWEVDEYEKPHYVLPRGL